MVLILQTVTFPQWNYLPPLLDQAMPHNSATDIDLRWPIVYFKVSVNCRIQTDLSLHVFLTFLLHSLPTAILLPTFASYTSYMVLHIPLTASILTLHCSAHLSFVFPLPLFPSLCPCYTFSFLPSFYSKYIEGNSFSVSYETMGNGGQPCCSF